MIHDNSEHKDLFFDLAIFLTIRNWMRTVPQDVREDDIKFFLTWAQEKLNEQVSHYNKQFSNGEIDRLAKETGQTFLDPEDLKQRLVTKVKSFKTNVLDYIVKDPSEQGENLHE